MRSIIIGLTNKGHLINKDKCVRSFDPAFNPLLNLNYALNAIPIRKATSHANFIE